MKKLLITLILIISMTAPVYSQSMKDFDLYTKTFDLNTFKEKIKNTNRDSYAYDLNNNIHVYQYDEGDNFIREVISQKENPYSVVRRYYPNGKLFTTVRQFYGFDIGDFVSFYENGNRKNVINCDYLYSFTVEDLIQKMKSLYGIDLSVRIKGITVRKNLTSPKDDIKPLYTVHYPIIEKDSIIRDGAIVKDRTFYIDGSNGKVTIEDYVELNSYLETEGEKKGLYITARYYEFNEKWGPKKITEKKLYINNRMGYITDIVEEKKIFESYSQ
ncbi:hypothetical protein GYM75_10085 [Gilliamella sp. ESL0441]|uniref:hypothetical protein n=1 Tax=Gilliamella sp. ESL0441 TaxID=2704654 RepID=UPI001C69A094|nr:hypothetical protein [Gilliamella sp. ESL0441]QYN45171.1 hypothetical protein GYM75_10085 [Gilliamella sp. ESL0441]